MRIGIIGLQHESNTFIDAPTTIDLFRRETFVIGDAVIDHYADAHHEIGGFIQGLRQTGADIVPIFAAWAMPAGVISARCADELLIALFDALDAAGRLDGLLVAPHGAGVSERHRDLDGYWLTQIRQRIGTEVPMVCTLDLHANLSPPMVDACNATIAYRTNPHLDQKQCGLDAARLLIGTLEGRFRPTAAAAFPPVAINIERQETAREPCRSLLARADQMLTRPGVLSNSVLLGFPYADVEEMGSAFIVVTDDDPPRAQALADELAATLWDNRHDFVANLTSIAEAIDQTARLDGPVCLLDMGDNIGGGSGADGTAIALAIDQRGGPRTFVAINDPESVAEASAAGPGATLNLRVGGKADPLQGSPLEVRCTVGSLHDGTFTEAKPRHGGRTTYQMGTTAIVETASGLVIQLTSKRTAPFSLNQITSCDIDPSQFQILIAKGVVAPIAAYAEVCKHFIRVNTPGVTTADVTRLEYHHRRRPLFPFEQDAPCDLK